MAESHLYTLNLLYENQTFEVLVDEATYYEVTKDDTTLQEYAKQVFEHHIATSGNSVARPEMHESDVTCGGSGVHKESPTDFKWTDNLIKCLLEVRLRRETEFNKPTCKKIKLWKLVAEEVNKIHSCKVTAEMCDTKYRNLLATYRANKKKQNSTGEASIKWEYFQTFDEVLGCKASSDVPIENIGDSLDDIVDDTTVSETELQMPSTTKSLNVIVPGKMKPLRRRNISFQGYLEEKLKRDEKKEKERAERAERQWQERKAMKEKEIDAIYALAKAISENAKK